MQELRKRVEKWFQNECSWVITDEQQVWVEKLKQGTAANNGFKKPVSTGSRNTQWQTANMLKDKKHNKIWADTDHDVSYNHINTQ